MQNASQVQIDWLVLNDVINAHTHTHILINSHLPCEAGLVRCLLNFPSLRGSCQPILRWTGEDNQVVPASAPSNKIWNTTTLRSPKQQIWLRIAPCGGWCWRMALHNLRVACQKRRRWQRISLRLCILPDRPYLFIFSLILPTMCSSDVPLV